MRAIQIESFGGPLNVVEIPDPIAAEGEILVTLSHAAVNPLDVWACQGNFAALTKLPHTPGAEGLGRDADGRLGIVNGTGVGIARQGTYAQQIAVAPTSFIPIPEGAPPEVAVSMVVAGVTAQHCVVDCAGTTADDVVLVLGASGGVGGVAAQLARNIGATVIGQTSSASKTAVIDALGVESIVAADGDDLVVALGDRKVSVVIDGLGGTFTGGSIACMKPFARLVNYGTSSNVEVTLNMRNLYRNGVRLIGYTGLLSGPAERQQALDVIFAEHAAGRITIPVDDVLPLSGAGEAHRRILDRAVTGKLVLDVNA